jgi:hypothetical protein
LNSEWTKAQHKAVPKAYRIGRLRSQLLTLSRRCKR